MRKRARKGGKDGSCSKEECIEGLKKFKISGDCIRAPFCIRQVLRDLKKVDKEKVFGYDSISFDLITRFRVL